jgi:nicotinate-nucleotide adenylyltransferase
MKRIAFYGGSFDPVHNGHLTIAQALIDLFAFDEFWFVPAFHAPHKLAQKVTTPLCRYAMLALATQNESNIKVSTIELLAPQKPFTVETLTKLKERYKNSARIFFVMGMDSWNAINTWRNWQQLMLLTSFVVVSRPGFEIETTHVTGEIKEKLVDVRGLQSRDIILESEVDGIFLTDIVQIDISASQIRKKISGQVSSQNGENWRKLVSPSVADYIEKYKLYS